jgi:hypothetical protein
MAKQTLSLLKPKEPSTAASDRTGAAAQGRGAAASRSGGLGLSARDVRGTLTSLQRTNRRARLLAPCWGPLLGAAPQVTANALTWAADASSSRGNGTVDVRRSFWGIDGGAQLAKELFVGWAGTRTTKPVATKSKAATHLQPGAFGSMLALATHGASVKTFEAVLAEQHGITSNRVRGEWTGVSLQRYKRLFEMLVHSTEAGGTLGVALAQRFVWETCPDREGLLEYLECVERAARLCSSSNTGILADGFDRAAFLAGPAVVADRGASFEFGPEEDVLKTSRYALIHCGATTNGSGEADDDALERLIATAVAATEGVSPAIRIRKQLWKPPSQGSQATNGHPSEESAATSCRAVADCVEVVVREIVRFAMGKADPHSWMEKHRLTPAAALLRLLTIDNDPSLTEVQVSDAWFQELQDLPSPCAYLLRTAGGGRYELAPSVPAVGAALCYLLGVEIATATATTTQNDTAGAPGPAHALRTALELLGCTVDYSLVHYRLPAAEEMRWKEVIVVRHTERKERWMEAVFEQLHPMAKTAHRAQPRDWRDVRTTLNEAYRGQQPQQHRLLAWQSVDPEQHPMGWLLDAAFHPDAILPRCTAGLRQTTNASDVSFTSKDVMAAVVCSRWAPGCDDWRPLESPHFHAEDTTIDELRAAGARGLAALHALRGAAQSDRRGRSAAEPRHPGAGVVVAEPAEEAIDVHERAAMWVTRQMPLSPQDSAFGDDVLGAALAPFPLARADAAATPGRVRDLVLGRPSGSTLKTHPVATVRLVLRSIIGPDT